MKLPKSKPSQLISVINQQESRRLYNSLVMLGSMMEVVSPESTWKTRLLDLPSNYKADVAAMGFPSDYKERAFWK